MPYFREEDIPEPMCGGSCRDVGWEGHWNDLSKPQEIVCPDCGIAMKPAFNEYSIESKKDIFFASVPSHYPGEKPEFY